ncbi:MAG TPA: hypothetical protein VKA30_05035 [Actinomycetota bacterium]|nr:hypothetical protein [Actinomycetota bacterium]
MRAKGSTTSPVDHAETLRRLEREVAKGERLAARVAAQILERRKHRAP